MGRKGPWFNGKLSKGSLGVDVGPVRRIDFSGRHLTERSLFIRRRDAEHHQLGLWSKGQKGTVHRTT